jgi:hypothetical protein
MRLTIINFFFKKNKKNLFTFRESEHEIVFLKRLGDNKIFYNNNIYDENFLDYDRLERFVKFINKYREIYINESFKKHIARMADANKTVYVLKFKAGRRDEWKRLTSGQYKILIDAYSYNFPYIPIEGISNDDVILDQAEINLRSPVQKQEVNEYGDFYESEEEQERNKRLEPLNGYSLITEPADFKTFKTLLDDWLYIVGWRSIKPVYTVFKPAIHKFYNDSDQVFMDIGDKNKTWYYRNKEKDNRIEVDDEFDWLNVEQWWITFIDPQRDYFVISPRVKRLKQYEGVVFAPNDLFRETKEDFKREDIFAKIKREYKDDGIIEFSVNHHYINFKDLKNPWIDENLINKHEDILNSVFNPLCEGSRLRHEWLEYDEQKKFAEFDISCKTNSYHMRYKYYNEVYWKDYPEDKKFKTESLYEFTEEEIKANFENMIDKEKTSIEKWNFIIKNSRNLDYLLELLKRLQKIEYNYRVHYYYDNNYWYEYDHDNTWVVEKSKTKIYQILNDPQYLLMMPVLDAFFEIFRINAWEKGDGTFLDFEIEDSYMITETKCLFFAMRLFELSLERQDFLNFLDSIAINDWLEDDDEDHGDQLEEFFFACVLSAGLFVWLVGLTAYFGIFCLPFWDIIYVSPTFISRYSLSFKDYFTHRRPPIYYGIELRRPRIRVPYYAYYKMPETFYSDFNYRFLKRRARGMLPFSIMEILDEFIDQDDAGLGLIDNKLRKSAVERGYDWRLKSER